MVSLSLQCLMLLPNPNVTENRDSRALTPPAHPFPFLFPFPFQEAKPDQEVPKLPWSPLILTGNPPSLGCASRARLAPEGQEHPWACPCPPGRGQQLQPVWGESAVPGDSGELGVLRAGTPTPPSVKPLSKDTMISVGFHVQGCLCSPFPDKTHPGTMFWGFGDHCWDQGYSSGKKRVSRGLEMMKATFFT